MKGTKADKECKWRTSDELHWLATIEHHDRQCTAATPERRRALLVGYRRSMAGRSRWAGIRLDEVREKVEQLLAWEGGP